MISARLLRARTRRWKAGEGAPDPGAALPDERRRKLAFADAAVVSLALEVARDAGLPVPLDRPRRLALLFAADSSPRLARAPFLAGPPPAGLASPTLFLHTAANFPAAQLAIALRSRGPSATFASGRDALERALLWLSGGATEEALVTGVRAGEEVRAAAALLARDRGGEGWRVEIDESGARAPGGDEVEVLGRLAEPRPPAAREVDLGGGMKLRWRASS